MVDTLTSSLPLDELQHSIGHLLVEALEEVVSPGDQGQLVDLIDPLPSLLAL